MNFGTPTLRYDSVGSTQDIAREMAKNGAPPGTVVTANFQTAGRGRRGRTWFAPPGANVCLTTIAPAVPADAAWQTALVAGLAVAEGVAKAAGVRTQVRFPNDVLVAGSKLAGVLIETAPAVGGGVIPLVGIGVNINIAGFPRELQGTATSLEQVTGLRRDVLTVERAVLEQLDLCWREWEGAGFAATLTRWKPLAATGACRTFRLDGKPAVCRVRDLTPEGALTVETAEGKLCTVPAAAVLLDEEDEAASGPANNHASAGGRAGS